MEAIRCLVGMLMLVGSCPNVREEYMMERYSRNSHTQSHKLHTFNAQESFGSEFRFVMKFDSIVHDACV